MKFNLTNKIEASLKLKGAYECLYGIPEIANCIDNIHTNKSPDRITKAIFEMFEGCWQDPEEVLSVQFEDNYDEIVYVNDVSFVSNCAHHNLSFFGKMHFGYLPGGTIVGLSKIPRLIELFSRRPQVQEKLTQDIVDTFMAYVEPKGCGLVVEAYHLCMMVRGINQRPAYTKTTALRGVFKTQESTKQEFLNGITKTTEHIWP
jgi:GTP cyclohydrolase I